MTHLSLKVLRLTAALVLLTLVIPVRTLAEHKALDNSAGATTMAPDAARPGTASAAQLLDEEEIATFSQRNQNPGPEVRGGALSNEHLTYIVIALAAIVLVLVLK